jgi:hypothetical protein
VTNVATVISIAKGLPAKDLKNLLATFPPADLKVLIDKLTVAGLIDIAKEVSVATLTRAKGHFGGMPMLLEVFDASKATTTTAVLKELLTSCFKNGFKAVAEIKHFFTHAAGHSEAQVREAIHGAEMFVAESSGNTTTHEGRTTSDPSAPVQKQFVVHGGAKVTLTFNAIDVQHISSRHTWAGFAMIPSNKSVDNDNTMFPAGTNDAKLWQWGRAIMNCADLVTLMATLAPGGKSIGASVNAGTAFKVNVNLDGVDGLVSFYADGGAGVLNLTKPQMKAAIRLWLSK